MSEVLSRARWLTSAMAPMPYRDWCVWRSCRTMADLSDCTARWLGGDLASQPGYDGPCDVDDAPDLRDALILLNRAGVLTSQSQEGWGGKDAYQYAWISGWATLGGLDTLARALPAGHTLYRRDRDRRDVPVTYWRGDPYTVAVGAYPFSEAYPDLHRDARQALRAAIQYDVVANWAGTNLLWPKLVDALSVYAEVD